MQSVDAPVANIQNAYANYQQAKVFADQATTNYLNNGGVGSWFYGPDLTDRLYALPGMFDSMAAQGNYGVDTLQDNWNQGLQQNQALQGITQNLDTTYKVMLTTEYACAGVVVGAGGAVVIVAATPWAVAGGASGLMLAGVGETTAIAASQTAVTWGLAGYGAYGVCTTGNNIYQNVSAGNYPEAAFDAGMLFGGASVMASGGAQSINNNLSISRNFVPTSGSLLWRAA